MLAMGLAMLVILCTAPQHCNAEQHTTIDIEHSLDHGNTWLARQTIAYQSIEQTLSPNDITTRIDHDMQLALQVRRCVLTGVLKPIKLELISM
jgi:hypothetical protein